MESTRRRCRVEKDWTSLLPVCAYMGTSERLVSGFSLFHCGLWQLKTHQGRRTDPVTPGTHMSELEAWAIVTFPPIVPWERTISVPVSCCSRRDKTTLLNMNLPHMHAQKKYDDCTADLFTHTHTFILLHISTKYTFWSLRENYRHTSREMKTRVCWNHSYSSSLCCFSKSELTITVTTTHNTKLITWGEQRFYSRKTPEAFRHKMAQYLAIGDDTKGSGMSPFSTDSSFLDCLTGRTLSHLFSPCKDNAELFPCHSH